MHLDINQSRKRRRESIIRHRTKFFFFFWWEQERVESELWKPVLFIKRTQHCSGMTLVLSN